MYGARIGLFRIAGDRAMHTMFVAYIVKHAVIVRSCAYQSAKAKDQGE